MEDPVVLRTDEAGDRRRRNARRDQELDLAPEEVAPRRLELDAGLRGQNLQRVAKPAPASRSNGSSITSRPSGVNEFTTVLRPSSSGGVRCLRKSFSAGGSCTQMCSPMASSGCVASLLLPSSVLISARNSR